MRLPIFLGQRLLLVLPLLLGACRSDPGVRVRADMKAFEREQTADKLLARGRAFAHVGDTTRAEQYFAAAVAAGADPAAVTPILLTVCLRDGRYRMAIEYARRHLGRHPNDVKVRILLGTVYAALGESNDAELALEAAAKADAHNADVRYALAVLFRDQRGDVERADTEFREYLRLSPRGEHAEEARASLLNEVP